MAFWMHVLSPLAVLLISTGLLLLAHPLWSLLLRPGPRCASCSGEVGSDLQCSACGADGREVGVRTGWLAMRRGQSSLDPFFAGMLVACGVWAGYLGAYEELIMTPTETAAKWTIGLGVGVIVFGWLARWAAMRRGRRSS